MLRLPVLPADRYERLLPRQWGDVVLPNEKLPGWVQSIPEAVHKALLGSGPAFEPGPKRDTLIDSEHLFADPGSVGAAPDSLQYVDENFYIVFSDGSGDNVLLLDPHFERDESWVVNLLQTFDGVSAYAARKHPQQAEPF